MKLTLYACALAALGFLLSPSARADMVVRRLGATPRGSTVKPSSNGSLLPKTFVPRLDKAPAIDGKLDDAVWQKAGVVNITRTLDGLNRADVETEIRLFHDGQNLYIGARAAEPRMDKLRGTEKGHDVAVWDSDSVEFFLGTGDKYYNLGITAAGGTYDAKAKDKSWDSGMKAAVNKGEREWIAEASIPLASMAGPGELPGDWIANFNRNRFAAGSLQELAWSPTKTGDSHVPEMFGKMTLEGLKIDKAASSSAGGPPAIRALRVEKPPVLDGKLDEETWTKAPAVHMAKTLNGQQKADVDTEVRVLYDDKNFYVGVRAEEPNMNNLRLPGRGHDVDIWDNDSAEIFLGARGAYYHYGVSAGGATYDGKGRDRTWNSDIKAATARGERAWTAEVAIPMAPMIGRGDPPDEWMAEFNRNRFTTGKLQEFSWSPTMEGDSHVPEKFGRLYLKEPAAEDDTAAAKPVMEIIQVQGGAGVARFDLSSIPAGARVCRADLRIHRTVQVDGRQDEAMTDIEIFPLFADVKAGGTPSVSEKPLVLVAPWYDRFDAAEAVKGWIAGKPNGGFFVKTLPFWADQYTCLDVFYEGKPEKCPPPAKEVKAFHRSGQTFVTWKEIEDLVARDDVKWGEMKLVLGEMDKTREVRYCIYRHTKPITAATLAEAEEIAAVRPLSCWNLNGRCRERPIDHYIATKDFLMAGHWNPFQGSVDGEWGLDCALDRLVIVDNMAPLPSGTGLYVDTAATKGEFYYAVVTSVDGVRNTADIGAETTAGPVSVAMEPPAPVLQKELPKGPFFNYREKRLHYVTWAAPPFHNLPYEYHNWSVGVPAELGQDIPLEVSLHRDGNSYWRTQYRIEEDSVVVTPHNFPVNTWWYGYHESLDTLKSFRQGCIQPYTERRILAFVDWAAKKWPVDRNRLLVTGNYGGASTAGALHFGLRHPEVFSLAIGGGPVEYTSLAKSADARNAGISSGMHAIWGKPAWALKTETGAAVWDELNMTKLVSAADPKTDLPVVGFLDGDNALFKALADKGYAFIGGGHRYVPISRTLTAPDAITLDIRKNLALPAIRTSDGSTVLWRSSDLRDEDDRFELRLIVPGPARKTPLVADATLRRLQKLKVEAGKSFKWTCKNSGGAQEGETTVGKDGLLVLNGVKLAAGENELSVTKR